LYSLLSSYFVVKNKIIFQFILTAFICFFANGFLSAKSPNQLPILTQISQIEANIENANLAIAEQQLLKLQKSNISIKQKYHCTKLLEKIYLTQQNFFKYSAYNDQLVKFAKQIHPIYLSEAYAYKAYYWHYLMWGDSALIYSNKSHDLLMKNRQFLAKIEPSFVYEVYATTYLYRRTNLKTNVYQIEGLFDYKPIQFQYFDSAIYYQEKFPLKFSSDKAMIYRSYGNRWLDLVGTYKNFLEPDDKKFKPIHYLSFRKANELYDKGLSCLKEQHINDFFQIIALKCLNYISNGKFRDGEKICDFAREKYDLKQWFNRSSLAYNPLMNFMTYKIRNDILLPYNKKEVDFDLKLLYYLKGEFWHTFSKNNDLPYDQYRTSPYSNLFTIYRFKNLNEPNSEKIFTKAVSNLLTMKCYFHYLDRKMKFDFNTLPYFDVAIIQKRLKKDECFILYQNSIDYLRDKKILISKNKIQIVKSLWNCRIRTVDIDTLSIAEFKKLSFMDYEDNFKDVLKILPNVKKVFISYDEPIPFEILIKDSTANSYDRLKYLGQDINFVRVYDPISYFSDTINFKLSQIDASYLVQNQKSKLLFMNDFFDNFHSSVSYHNSKYEGNLKELMLQRGILHFYGHGVLAINKSAESKGFEFSYFKNGKLKTERQLTGKFDVKRDLVILNNCFSGYSNMITNEFNRTIPLRILNNGAKAVISSPSKVDDFSSAAIFNLFYQNIEKGMLYEDALFEAKRTFFKEHPELRQPHYWNAFQLVQSYKLKNEISTSHDSEWLLFSAFCLLDILLFLAYFSKQKRVMIRH
jgi:hypothetical protein